MKELIDVFRMKEIPADIRIKFIKKLGRAINDESINKLVKITMNHEPWDG